MIRTLLTASAFLAAASATAQSIPQDELEARYDRAIAAGYKALFVCSALANNREGVRDLASVEAMELTGIHRRVDRLMGELEAEIHRAPSPVLISHVAVEYAADAPPVFAVHKPEAGCSLAPIGTPEAALPGIFPSMVASDDAMETAASERRPLENIAGWEAAFDGTYGEGSRTTSVLVRQGGRFVGGGHIAGFDFDTAQRTWSVAKSIAATMVGAAVQRGEADVRASAGLGSDDGDPRRAITIDHLLRMASGRYSDTAGANTQPLYFGGSTVEEAALHWPLLHKPGTMFRYANNDTLAAVKAIEKGFAENPPSVLFDLLDMDSTVAETDWRGDYILSSQVWSTPNDLAKLGELYLRDGLAPDGTRILPLGWVEYVSTPSGPQPDAPFGYGAGFWLLNGSEGVPPDTFVAMGNRGQYIVIVPSMNVVIVRRGEDPVGTRFDIASFTRDVLKKLEK